MATITTTQTTQVKLSAMLKRQLLLKLKTFETLKDQIDANKLAQEKLKGEIEAMFVKAGEFSSLEAGVRIDGFTTKYVSGGRTKKLDKKLLMANTKITTTDLKNATKETPKKPYVMINVPGDKEEEEE